AYHLLMVEWARMPTPEQLDVSRWRHIRHRYRESVGPVMRELRPIAVLGLAVLALVLGTIGYMRLHGTHYDVFDAGYRSISLVRGDATDAAILRHARTGHARYLVVVCGEDSVNVDVATAARAIVPSRRAGTLTALVHVDDLGLWQALQAEAVALSADIPLR